MLAALKEGPKVAGVKQTQRAIADGRVKLVFLAEDADPRVTAPIERLCAEHGASIQRVPKMKDLGTACGIAVGSAVAALLR